MIVQVQAVPCRCSWLDWRSLPVLRMTQPDLRLSFEREDSVRRDLTGLFLDGSKMLRTIDACGCARSLADAARVLSPTLAIL